MRTNAYSYQIYMMPCGCSGSTWWPSWRSTRGCKRPRNLFLVNCLPHSAGSMQVKAVLLEISIGEGFQRNTIPYFTLAANNFTCFSTSYFFILICCIFLLSFNCELSMYGALQPVSFMIHHTTVTVNNRIILIARWSINSQIQDLLQL